MMDNPFDPLVRELDMIRLAVLVLLPAAVALLLLIIPNRRAELARWVALVGAAGTLTLGLCTLVDLYTLLDSYSDHSTKSLYTPATRLDTRSDQQTLDAARAVPRGYSSFDLVCRRPWVERFDLNFALGVDGVSLALVLVVSLVTAFAVVSSWAVDHRPRDLLALMLLLETGLIGALLALDLVLVVVSLGVVLVATYLLLAGWGGGRVGGRFAVAAGGGGAGLLLAVVALGCTDVRDFTPAAADDPGRSIAVHTFDPVTLGRVGRAVALILDGHEDRIAAQEVTKEGILKPAPATPAGPVPLLSPGADRAAAVARLKGQILCTPWFQYTLFGLVAGGFAALLPLVPLHGWRVDAQAAVPGPVGMLLAGGLAPLGGYGLYRFAFPSAPWAATTLAWWVGLAAVVGLGYGTLAALGTADVRRRLALGSAGQMGYVVLGLAAGAGGADPATAGAGVNGAIFLLFAHALTASGLFAVADGHSRPGPAARGLTGLLLAAAAGLPGLSGFWGVFLVLVGAWGFAPALAVPAVLATIPTAAYLLGAWRPLTGGTGSAGETDSGGSARAVVVLSGFGLLAVGLGVVPGLVTGWVDPAVTEWVDDLARLR